MENKIEEKEMLDIITQALEDKKAMDILTIDVKDKTSICDYFIIASAKSAPAVKALCDNVDEKMSKVGNPPRRREGYTEGRWIVLDFGDIIVHMFHDETRLFYHLERLWQ